MEELYARTKILIGQQSVDKLINANILIVGVGGVGGYALEILARCGVGGITIVDGDCVDKTNLNRQIIALESTIGQPKVYAFAERIKDINPSINIVPMNMRFNNDTLNMIFHTQYDFVIDAIDSVEDKLLLIKTCKERNIEIISAMGAGNRHGVCDFKVMDIYKTFNDGLAKKMRKLLRESGIISHNVVCTEMPSMKINGEVGSIAYMPALCGVKLASFVIEKLINSSEN